MTIKTTNAPTGDDNQDDVSPARPSPMRRLWQRYLKARGAKVGLVLIACFGGVAFLAPFLAHRLPFFWYDHETGRLTFPLFREFFSPSDTTEPFLEKGINFLLLFIPLSLLLWKLFARFLPTVVGRESRLVSLLFGAMFSAVLWFSIGGMVAQGAGADWFHSESPPVPEVDDVLDSTAFGKPPSDPAKRALWDSLFSRAPESLALEESANANQNEREAHVRGITAFVQSLIEGPALAAPADLAAAGQPPLDITDANLELGINRARLNRLAVETAFPGLLVPMRQFRSAFLTLAVAALLVLLGLTYIFMAGANQFNLSPRWLLLLLFGFVLSLPFAVSPRHDHTPYRRLASEGKGTGLFPIIPYGPNEQGFGPRLPPSWYVDSPLLTVADVRSWLQLKLAVKNDELGGVLPLKWAELAEEGFGRDNFIQIINAVLARESLYKPERHDRYRNDLALAPYLAELAAGRELSHLDQLRLNRLLLEKDAPGALRPVQANRWKKPRHSPGLHFLGTDESGRDVLVRVIHGARVSLSVGLVSVFMATVIGLVMGSLAAYYGGWADMLISRFLEIMICFPSFFLILAVIAVLDKRSIINIMLVIGLTSWTGIARLVRGEMLRHKKMDYVAASVALGASDTRTIFRQILPNSLAPVLVSISFGITGAILTEASLSFIGFGVTPPTPTWGQLLSETRESPLANWWLAVFPGAVLFVSVVAYNLAGEALRDALDPRATL